MKLGFYRVRASRLVSSLLLYVVLIGTTTASLAADSVFLENGRLKVEVDNRFPRVLRYEVKDLGAALPGAVSSQANVVEVNGAPFTELSLSAEAPIRGERKYRIYPKIGGQEARYTFRIWETYGVITFDIVFQLVEDSLVMRLERVSEGGDFRLQTLYFPNHQLVSVRATDPGASAFRAEFYRTPWDERPKGLIRWKRIFNGPLSELAPDQEVEPTHWAMVSTSKVVAVLDNNIPVFPVDTLATGSGRAADAISLWNGPYHYRVGGEIVEPLVARISLLGDVNADGETDWVDGAIRLRDTMSVPGPEYSDTFVCKIFCSRPPSRSDRERLGVGAKPNVTTTFAQSLEIVRKLYHLTHHRRQIMYLVGWQHLGHDDKWPDFNVVNPYLGGKAELINVMNKAREYNAVISLHLNIDGSYKNSPAWRDDVIARRPDGELMQWQEFNGWMSHHVSHQKDVRQGDLLARIDRLLDTLPLEKSVHIDAMRYTNESWEPDGFIDMTAEFHAWKKIYDHWRQRGISITTESASANPAFVGKVAGFWHLLGRVPGKEYFWFLAHRRWVGGGANSPERQVFGTSRHRDINGREQTPMSELVEGYYLDTLVFQHLNHFEATDYEDDGNTLKISYGNGKCTATYDRAGDALRVVSGGIAIAVGSDRFVPVDETTILAYSKIGGRQEWRLPMGWNEGRITIHRLTEAGVGNRLAANVHEGRIVFDAPPSAPLLIRREEGASE